MSNLLVLNYDHLHSFTKQFRDEGEDIVQLYSNTRQRMHLLRDEWSGEAADAFYDEMELEFLPALQRISDALFLCNEVLTKIIKITYNAEEETASFFGKDFDSSFEFGGFQKYSTSYQDQPSSIYSYSKVTEEFHPDEKPFSETGNKGVADGDNIDNEDSRV